MISNNGLISFDSSMNSKLLIGIIILLGCLTCSKVTSPPDDPTLEELLSAPEQILLEEYNLRLDTLLWRDFAPMSDPEGSSLFAVTWIVETDSLTLPEWVKASMLWVVYNGEVWNPEILTTPHTSAPPFKVQQYASGGPRWPIGVLVDAIVEIDRGKNCYLLRAHNQPIKRTD